MLRSPVRVVDESGRRLPAAAYELSWFDAHLWAYAEPRLLSEDFEHGRLFGTVEVVDPFPG